MPANKNAMTRYKILDELLSNKYQNNSLDDLTQKVNDELAQMGISAVTRRSIEKDIRYLEFEGPYLVEIERYSVAAQRESTQKVYNKRCLRYMDSSFSIFKKDMTDDEKYLLCEALTLLGQFDGLPNFERLEGLAASLKVSNRGNIISFTKNPLENRTLIGELFSAISNQQVVDVQYRTFSEIENIRSITLHPYMLKEYNRRWFLFARMDADDKILTFSLDRIVDIAHVPHITYREYDGDLSEHFEDIIGVTLRLENPVEKILFWVSDNSKHYVATKPIHESQIHYQSSKEQHLRKQYQLLNGGFFFSIECRNNYELIRELSSFGADLLVLSPENVQSEVIDRVEKMLKGYNNLRK